MRALVQEKETAVMLRKRGYSYRDILRTVPVAKSTLSEWLKDFPLTRVEKDALKRRKDSNISRGRIRAAAALSALRLERERIIRQEAVREYQKYSGDPLFKIGVALYWAEGSKRHGGFSFINSDPDMIIFMITWMETFLHIYRIDIKVRLYIHKPCAHENHEQFWSKYLAIPACNFQRTIYKPTGLLIKKRPNYRGCLRITVDKVSLRLKMLFWQRMLIEDYRKR